MVGGGKYATARSSTAERQPSYYKNVLMAIGYTVGCTIVALCIWPASAGDILAKLNGPTFSTLTSDVSNRNHNENRAAGISFQERWSAVPPAEPTGTKNQREPPAEGSVEKLPFSCELAFSRLVQTGNFSTRCIASSGSKTATGWRSFPMNKYKPDNAKRTGSKLSNAIDAVDLNIRKCLLRQHLSHWHPISTAPHNQDLEIDALDKNALIKLPFPCRRTNASDWINTDLGTRVNIQPVRWRVWQKASA
jgi:hypothetical protein